MIRRHPRVFSPENDGKIIHLGWIKGTRKENIQNSALDGVSKSLPALMVAYKLQEKAAKLDLTGMSLILFGLKFPKRNGEFKEAIDQNDRENMEKKQEMCFFP